MLRVPLLAALLVPAPLAAQSSIFGVPGVGLPGRGVSAASAGTGGSFALFDPGSALNPAAPGVLTRLTAGFNGIQSFRSAETPAGSASLRDTRFPLVIVGGPIRRTPLVISFGYGNYASRDFSLVSGDTVTLRGMPVAVSDTFTSTGGLGDIRAAVTWVAGEKWHLGAAGHVITGSNRVRNVRVFGDTAYRPIRQTAELSYLGGGVSLGVVGRPTPRLAVAAIARWDGSASLDRDSSAIGTIDLPYTFGAGVRWAPTLRVDVAAHAIYRTWSAANSDLLRMGEAGAENTIELAAGGQYYTDPERTAHRPIRFGARYATLPFLLVAGEQPTEFGVSAGTGFRFAEDRAGLDVALERVWRSGGEDYSETSWQLQAGVTIRP